MERQTSTTPELNPPDEVMTGEILDRSVDFDDIDYFTHADLLYDLAGQLVQHLRGYLSEDGTISVLDRDRRLIARDIHAQMMARFWEESTAYEVQVSRGFTELKPCNYIATAGQSCCCLAVVPARVGLHGKRRRQIVEVSARTSR